MIADADSSPEACASPLGLAQLVAIDAQAHSVRWHLPSAVQALPAQLVGVAHLAGGVRVQCPLQGTWAADGAQGWSLTMPGPPPLLQWQRRRHPRLQVPLGQHYSASFLFGRRRCVLDIDDLSLGGVALRGTRAETAMLFLGKTVPKVQLRMADDTQLQATLQVRARRSYRSFLLGEQVLVGCSWEAMAPHDHARLAELLERGVQPPRA